MGVLTSKIALVTGASSGFGEAIAKVLAKDGCKLIITGRRKERLDALAKELGVPTHVLVFDVRDRAAMQAALKSLPKEFHDVDILVNNAGLAAGLDGVAEGSYDDWDQMLDTNVRGLIGMSREVLPGMKARGRGHVVNISSTAGNYPYAGAAVYGGSKAFVTTFSLALRADLLGTPIRVTNLEPAMAETEFSNVRFKGDEGKADAVYAGVKALQAEDIAEAVRWALAQPAHVNVNRMEIMPVGQAPAGLAVHRG